MYVNLIQDVAERLADELIEAHEEDRGSHYERIYEEINNRMDQQRRRKAEYYAEQIHKNAGWGVLLNVVFGEDTQISNDGYDGLREYVMEMHTGYIQNKSEHGHHRANLFEATMGGEPKWLKEMVAQSELDYYENTDPSFWNDETEEYVELLRDITGE